jgi:hypothetical protein
VRQWVQPSISAEFCLSHLEHQVQQQIGNCKDLNHELKSTVYFLLGGLLTTTMLLAESSKPSFSLTISTPTSTVVAGSQVRIDIEKKNTSDHPINVARMVSDNQGELDYHVIVRNAQGQEPPETTWGVGFTEKKGRAMLMTV